MCPMPGAGRRCELLHDPRIEACADHAVAQRPLLFQVMASCSTSFAEGVMFVPLDVVKTRLQLQDNSSVGAARYRGLRDAFAKIYRAEGLPALWRGVFPIVASDMPRRSAKFVIFEHSKALFQFGAPQPSPLTYVLAGGLAGLVDGLLQTPFDIIKIAQQADRTQSLGTIVVARSIIQKHGCLGLYRGVRTAMIRNSLFHIIHFGLFYSVHEGTSSSDSAFNEFLRSFAIAFAAGLVACTATIPLDTAKTRIQGPQPVPGQIKYESTFGTIATVCQEEGYASLYKSLPPALLRVGFGGSLLLLGYEFVSNILVRLPDNSGDSR